MVDSGLWRIVPRAVFARVAPFALFLGLIALASLAPPPLPAGAGQWDTRWLHALRGPVIAIVLLVLWREYHELAAPRGVLPRQWVMAVIAGVFVFVAWINLDTGWMRLGDGLGFDPSLPSGGGLDWRLVTMRLLTLALVVPVMEELFWRSFLLRWIQQPDFLRVAPAAVGAGPFLITAVLFALEHNLWLAGLIAGAVYNWVYLRSGNLWTVLLAHAVTNSLLGVYILTTRNWDFW